MTKLQNDSLIPDNTKQQGSDFFEYYLSYNDVVMLKPFRINHVDVHMLSHFINNLAIIFENS